MAKASVKALALTACLTALPLMVGLGGCAGARHHQTTAHLVDDNPTASSSDNQSQDQRIEDSRTAERVREALAAGADYKYDGAKVMACKGVIQLSGFVNTRAQRESAGEVASKVVGVKTVENNLMVKD